MYYIVYFLNFISTFRLPRFHNVISIALKATKRDGSGSAETRANVTIKIGVSTSNGKFSPTERDAKGAKIRVQHKGYKGKFLMTRCKEIVSNHCPTSTYPSQFLASRRTKFALCIRCESSAFFPEKAALQLL